MLAIMNMYGHARSLNKPCLCSHVSDNRLGEGEGGVGEWERPRWQDLGMVI